jgi:hypothetical protein
MLAVILAAERAQILGLCGTIVVATGAYWLLVRRRRS